MLEIIDLSQEIFTGMPVFPGLPDVKVSVHLSHEELEGVAAFGVEPAAPGVRGVSNGEVHRVCGELGFTHYENMCNLHRLVGRGRFRFIGLPLRIRGGTGSPVRAVAVFEG